MRFINKNEIIERLTKDVKNNKELLQSIANFVCFKEVEKVEFEECIYSYDSDDRESVMIVLKVDDNKIGIQFTF